MLLPPFNFGFVDALPKVDFPTEGKEKSFVSQPQAVETKDLKSLAVPLYFVQMHALISTNMLSRDNGGEPGVLYCQFKYTAQRRVRCIPFTASHHTAALWKKSDSYYSSSSLCCSIISQKYGFGND